MIRFLKNIMVLNTLFFWNTVAIGQVAGVDQVLTKVATLYKDTPSYAMEMEYTMFRGLTGENITESYSGAVTKISGVYHYSIMGAEIIQWPTEKIVIDSNQKMMVYSKEIATDPTTSIPGDISNLLHYYKENAARIEGDHLICELVAKNSVNPLPYGKIIITANKDNYNLIQQELFFSRQLPFKDGDAMVADFGRLQINMSPMQSPKDTSEFIVQNYT